MKTNLIFSLNQSIGLLIIYLSLNSCVQKKENKISQNEIEEIHSSQKFETKTLYVKHNENLNFNQEGKVVLFLNERDSIKIEPLFVKNLRIYPNLFHEFPAEILQFKNLEFLWLGMQNFETLPIEISSLNQLKCIDFQHSSLKELPEEIGQLENLKELVLLFTNVEKIPNSIGDLKNLEYLHLGGTKIKDIPSTISKLQNLKKLIYFSEDGENSLKHKKEEIKKWLPKCEVNIN